MRDIGAYHLKSDLLLSHYFKPETEQDSSSYLLHWFSWSEWGFTSRCWKAYLYLFWSLKALCILSVMALQWMTKPFVTGGWWKQILLIVLTQCSTENSASNTKVMGSISRIQIAQSKAAHRIDLLILGTVPNTKNPILVQVGYLQTLKDGSHHAGVIIGLLGGADNMKLREVGRKCLGTIYEHLLQTGQILFTVKQT